jgi:hypothetical protein
MSRGLNQELKRRTHVLRIHFSSHRTSQVLPGLRRFVFTGSTHDEAMKLMVPELVNGSPYIGQPKVFRRLTSNNARFVRLTITQMTPSAGAKRFAWEAGASM